MNKDKLEKLIWSIAIPGFEQLLNGRAITSNNGEFRVTRMNNKNGDYILELKLKHKDQD